MSEEQNKELKGKLISLTMKVNRHNLFVIDENDKSLLVCMDYRKDSSKKEQCRARISKKDILTLKIEGV